jgi:hypothetical protein
VVRCVAKVVMHIILPLIPDLKRSEKAHRVCHKYMSGKKGRVRALTQPLNVMDAYGRTRASCHSWFALLMDALAQVAMVLFVSHCSMVEPPKEVCTRPIGGAVPSAEVAASSSLSDSPK